MQHVYDLRCVFEYASKPTWKSQWNTTDGLPTDSAWRQNLAGLLYGIIEGKHKVTKEIVRIAEISADDFCCFQWIAMAGLPLNSSVGTVRAKNIGLKILARKKEINVFVDGSVSIQDRLEFSDDKLLHYGRESIL